MLGRLLMTFLMMAVMAVSLPRHTVYNPTEDYQPTIRPKVTHSSHHNRTLIFSRILTGTWPKNAELNRRVGTDPEDTIQPQRRSPTQNGTSRNPNTQFPSTRANQTSMVARPPTGSVTQQSRPDKSGDIVFPEGNHYPASFVPRHLNCRGKTFCEDGETDYPRDHIKRVLEQDALRFEGFFGEDIINETVNISNRIDRPDEFDMCTSNQTVIYPQQAKNKDEQWLYVVNQSKYIQGVQVEMCTTNGSCSFPGYLPSGYSSECVQKYVYRKLVAIHEKTGELFSDNFKFPSCCVCRLKSLPFARMGSLLPKDTSPAVRPKSKQS